VVQGESPEFKLQYFKKKKKNKEESIVSQRFLVYLKQNGYTELCFMGCLSSSAQKYF
jgi:hypothetical protein